MTQDRKNIIAEAAEAEAQREYPFDSFVWLGSDKVPSRSATQGARYSAYKKALVRSAERVEGVIERAKSLYAAAEKTVDAPLAEVEGHLIQLSREVDRFDAALNEYQKP